MIAGFNFFGLDEGAIFDTPLCTEMLDEMTMYQGTYDEVYVDLNVGVTDTAEKPVGWSMQTIMNAKFTGDLDAGSVGADGYAVTHIQVYRTVEGSNKWDLISQFDYDEEYNVYEFIDRYAQNAVTYRYAVVPVANEVMGDRLVSGTVDVSYEGIFITDRKENRRLEHDIVLAPITYTMSEAVNLPLNGQYPIIVTGNTNYRTGNLSTLPLSKETQEMYGAGVNKLAEQINREKWIEFLTNRKAKVLRMDSGVLMLIMTSQPVVTHKEQESLRDLASISFNYTETGELEFYTMVDNDLLAEANMSKFTYSENGEVIEG